MPLAVLTRMAGEHERPLVIYGAIAANTAIALTKFIAAAITHSGAMFSEGIHSLVDTGDGLLLLLGLHLSKRPASKRHPYGHGLEIYFWSMVVAMAIFGVGGGVSVYEGIQHLMEQRQPEASWFTYAVLGASFLFEGISFVIGLRAFRRASHGRPFWVAVHRAKDPTTFVIVLEDSAALIGILIATAGITLSHVLATPVYDAIASILIGLLLGAIAAILGRETRSLLIGESATPELVESVRGIAAAHAAVTAVDPPRTMHIGPESVHVDLDVHVDPSLSGAELLETARAIEDEVRRQHPVVHRVSLRFPA